MPAVRAKRLVMTAALVVSALSASCGGSDRASAGGDGCGVVVTTDILGDIVANVIGDQAAVEVLLDTGTDPHQFAPSAAQAAQLEEADLVIANGLGLEEGLRSALESAEQAGVEVLEVAPELDPLALSGADEHEEQGDQGAYGGLDPHFWMDPLRVAEASGVVGAGIARACGIDADSVARQAESYRRQVLAVDAEVEAVLEAVPAERRALVTNHDTLGYLAARYGFEVIGVVIPGGSTLAEPSAGELSRLAEEIERAGVPAVFAETTESVGLAEALAAETGSEVEVITLQTESLGQAGSDADTYLGLMQTTARQIAGALG
ncbi:MAG: Manganese-binding lipoprotein MntA [Acidimicrobiales bacterium]|nr:MAG: zinc ABC transporter substrate-binding protein [Actinomycetota bacterium]MBV6509042.1 Manganese-binding lipoprotein MntA [Acidimicrobiales bacterium]RIK06250.1 MAG: zinc ABC transporter substrate-binding protein [Acidobacteriota bacterium]